ncbi:hypothetical protein B5F34_10545 [Mediterranea sp. An20]|uniref:hypothetical protein n=1 Tax=Mediterranea sp. An20 TaxID=1965586 RepID=UPI000B392083|nr:hypothetical protein [Mediterranea sp. An20]OUP07773.1 hypothetical protein B5F34_10545 [Mediterranea sp. An20]
MSLGSVLHIAWQYAAYRLAIRWLFHLPGKKLQEAVPRGVKRSRVHRIRCFAFVLDGKFQDSFFSAGSIRFSHFAGSAGFIGAQCPVASGGKYARFAENQGSLPRCKPGAEAKKSLPACISTGKKRNLQRFSKQFFLTFNIRKTND